MSPFLVGLTCFSASLPALLANQAMSAGAENGKPAATTQRLETPPDPPREGPPAAEATPTASPCPTATLERAIEQAATPAARAHACLAAARCVLVLKCAAPLTRELETPGSGGEMLRTRVDRGLSYLHAAEEAIARLPEEEDDGVRRTLEDRMELLRSFGRLFAAVADGAATEPAKARLTDACIGLAMYMDDARPGVVRSAKLWQAAAYRRAGRPDRALQLLAPGLAATSCDRIGFLARIERCRALADGGRYVAALSAALRLGARVEDWFKNEDAATRKRARNTLLAIRVETFKRWAADLRKNGDTDSADRAEVDAKRIADKRAGTGEWLSLTETIAGLADWAPPARSAASQPDATPETDSNGG